MKTQRFASFRKVAALVKKFDSDQKGAEGLEKLLILAAVVLPLLGLLIFLRDEIKDWVGEIWSDQKSDAENWEDDLQSDTGN